MKIKMKSKSTVLMILTMAVILLLFWFMYSFYLLPNQEEQKEVESQLKMEKKMLTILQQKYTGHQNDLGEGSKALQAQLPVQPLVDQFLLQMEKAEIMSDSTINSISIADGNQMSSMNSISTAFPQAIGNGSSQAATKSQSQGQATSKSPEQLRKVTLQMSVSSSDYTKMKQFLQVIEEQSRIATVDTISFNDQPEQYSQTNQSNQDGQSKQPAKELKYQISVSTYYTPNLMDLMNDIPWIKHPEPSHKDNPLYSGETTDDASKKSE
jgi:type IV pilus assembly protein PilO